MITLEASKYIQEAHKSKNLGSRWIQGMETWFGKWSASYLLHDVLIDSFVNEKLQDFFAMPLYHTLGKVWRSLHMLNKSTKPSSSLNGGNLQSH